MISGYLPLEDYGLIGDCRSAALVSRTGSIDWLCLPRFDSPSIFNSLLDRWRGGSFSIAPEASFDAKRHYLDEMPVLVTEFKTESGRIRLTDFMPALSEEQKRGRLLPFWSLIRIIECVEGEMQVNLLCRPRPSDGEEIARFKTQRSPGVTCDFGNRLLRLDSDLTLHAGSGEIRSLFKLTAGERRIAWLSYAEDAPAVYPYLASAAKMLEETLQYWKSWTERGDFKGPDCLKIIKSALALKLLCFSPAGSITAAPTTSLPEEIGGVRNWDYRFCWLRDAAWTAQAFLKLGYPEEASAFMQWLMHTTAQTHPVLKVFYTLYGEPSIPERNVDSLEGYAGSAPVRTGNAAEHQYQLDVYGEVMEAFWLYVKRGGTVDRAMKGLVKGVGHYVAKHWNLPDHGLWECRSERRHYLHSKAMCWYALKRAEDICHKLDIRVDFEPWRVARMQIEHAILQDGYDTELNSFVQSLGSKALDAAVLMIPLVGIIPASDWRIQNTLKAIRAKLSHNDLIRRYDTRDGLPGQDGAFLACSFWAAEVLARSGQKEEAARMIERLEGYGNDLGLFSEEIDLKTGRMLGNFPQALSHLSHISARLSLIE